MLNGRLQCLDIHTCKLVDRQETLLKGLARDKVALATIQHNCNSVDMDQLMQQLGGGMGGGGGGPAVDDS